jgi:outer membrane PBP1 activator LpoA protein
MKSKKTIILCLACILCSCVKTNTPVNMAASVQSSTYPEPVDYYQKKAEQSEDLYERNDYLLKVAGRLIQESTISRAQQQLNALTQLTPEQQNEKNILNAKIALLKQHPQQALRFASKIAEPTTLPAPLQSFYHQVLASSYHLKGEVINEISQLIELDNFQQIPEHKLATRQKIWQSISKLPLEKEKVLTIDAQGEIEGWLALNLAVRENRDNSDNLLAAIQAWKSEHPNHPANNILISTSNRHDCLDQYHQLE